MTNADTAMSATNVAAIMETADALANAEDDDPDEDAPPVLPPLPPPLLPDPVPIPTLPPAVTDAAAEDEADAPLPDDSEDCSRFLLSSSSGLSYVFSQYTVGNSS